MVRSCSQYDSRPLNSPPFARSRSRPPHQRTSPASTRAPTFPHPSDHRESTFGPSPRQTYTHPSTSFPRSPTGSHSSDEVDSDDGAASTAYTSLSEPDDDDGHHGQHHHPSRGFHRHAYYRDGLDDTGYDDDDVGDGLADALRRKLEAQWAAEDDQTSRRRAEIRAELKNSRTSDARRQTTPGPSRPASPLDDPTRTRSRSRPAHASRAESYVDPMFDDDLRARRTKSYPQPEDLEEEYWRRERWAPSDRSRTRPPSPHRERAWRAGQERFGRGPERRTSYDRSVLMFKFHRHSRLHSYPVLYAAVSPLSRCRLFDHRRPTTTTIHRPCPSRTRYFDPHRPCRTCLLVSRKGSGARRKRHLLGRLRTTSA